MKYAAVFSFNKNDARLIGFVGTLKEYNDWPAFEEKLRYKHLMLRRCWEGDSSYKDAVEYCRKMSSMFHDVGNIYFFVMWEEP